MKAIFLDIDGVLNSTAHTIQIHDLLGREQYKELLKECQEIPFNYPSCKLMKQLIEMSGARVVLSSSWRIGSKPYRDIIEKYAGIHIDDATPVLNTKRGEEIACYLIDHPEIDDYVIIDDDSDMLQEQMTHFIHVDNDVGFNQYYFRLAIEKLHVINTHSSIKVGSYAINKSREYIYKVVKIDANGTIWAANGLARRRLCVDDFEYYDFYDSARSFIKGGDFVNGLLVERNDSEAIKCANGSWFYDDNAIYSVLTKEMYEYNALQNFDAEKWIGEGK